jgi:3-methylcrotonyl-CoA carboxylase alpha subunit
MPIMESVLIANRGEIARRIIRTARRIGIRTIAVYSDADANAPFVREADLAVRIGPAPARESYLSSERILSAARHSGAAAIHPGYGFLSENAAFAEAVVAAGLVWVGAPASAIRAMGRKDAAKALMLAAGVPVTPGYLGADQNVQRLAQAAAETGYPVLIKAVAGGGGKGMRKVDEPHEFEASLASCRREAAAAFGDDRVLIEKYIPAPRHIEVQVFGDTHGQIVHLFERDCSLQRRHQKVIEEAPAPGMDAETREFLCGVAVKAAAAVDYVGAGTIEFIADASQGLKADRIWFMEMNTRLQVEHPVTEAITGQDLVEWQLRVAGGERLPQCQQDLHIDGWAMEARLYAENPTTGFLPSTGTLRHMRWPDGLRVDSGVEEGGEVTGHYDPMLAKLIVHGPNRAAAARRLAAACGGVEVWPVRTNAALLARIAADPAFIAGEIDTGFIERRADVLIPAAEPDDAVVRAAARALLPDCGADPDCGTDPWSRLTGFRSAGPPQWQVAVAIGGKTYVASVEIPAGLEAAVGVLPTARVALVDGLRVLFRAGEAWRVAVPTADGITATGAVADGALRSPMPGRVVNVSVRRGEIVRKDQLLLALEAMKMEHAMRAPFDGVVVELTVAEGAQVAENVVLVRIAASS